MNKYDETLNILCILLKGGEKGRGGEERGWGRGRGERRGHDIDTKPCMILAYRHANDFDGVSEVSVTFRNGLHTIAAPRSSYQHRIGTSCAYHIGEQVYPSLTLDIIRIKIIGRMCFISWPNEGQGMHIIFIKSFRHMLVRMHMPWVLFGCIANWVC